MTEVINAAASPEKRLFVSLITRDIGLVAAFLDLVDNSVNSAIERYSAALVVASDYQKALGNDQLIPGVDIRLTVTKDKVEITDSATGISSKTAESHVFRFGRPEGEAHPEDRLSVYGIGLKRALFKLGNQINMKSEHVDGGFDLDLNVADWAKTSTLPWTIPIFKREAVDKSATGTEIRVTELHDATSRRIADGIFVSNLKDAISKTYSFYISKYVNIYLNDEKIEGVDIGVADNFASETVTIGEVSFAITAGIGRPVQGGYRDPSAGWFVLCNGRTIVSADKSMLTGWGSLLPLFQPKHRPFIGIVFFASSNGEQLPWNTTKSGIDEDNAIWQLAKRQMATTGRQVISFLDNRYSDEGTDIISKDLQGEFVTSKNILMALTPEKKLFVAPKKPKPTTIRIQYDALPEEVSKVSQYLRRPTMSAREVGRFTFDHFLKNEVGED